jgi:hypothetical protein
MAKVQHMTNLKTEYTDVKENKHKVEHHVVSEKDGNSKEQVIEELLHALTRPGKRIPA